ncbi:MAG: efflux RND transporter periplasmic adaptor subunit, partial [Elusimicrobia bacterium]|nr:efflux RND transporter periplasmic adaptor subunit [Elusimicrobiota bacterium]
VTKGDIEKHFVDSGEISPKHFVDVASQVSGRAVSVAAAEGARVRKGDELCVIQPGRSEADHFVPVPVKAPIDGIVMRYQKEDSRDSSFMVRVGDAVSGLADTSSPTYLMTVADLSRLVVRMRISEMDVLKLREGMAVKVTVDALRGTDFPAKISMISPQAEKDSNGIRSFRVDVSLDKVDPRLKPGMSARVDGLLDARKGILKIPLSAVFEEAGKELAYVDLGEKEKPKKVPLKLGLRSETDAELLEGPKPGEKLLTEKPIEKPKG